MAVFSYRAVDAGGRTRSGVIESGSAAGARRSLREQKLLPVALDPMTEKDAAGGPAPRLFDWMIPAVPGGTLALFTRQLATLVDSGIRIEEALATVASQCRQRRAASVLLDVRAGILDGRTFAQSLGDHPDAFSEFFRASIAAAEETNRLGPVLLRLADHVETRRRNLQTVRLALLYPALLAAVSLLVIVLLLTYVVPDIARVFTSRGEPLPTLTALMIAISEGIGSFGWLIAAGLGAAVLGIRLLLRSPRRRLLWHRFLLRSRLTSGFSRSASAAQFAGTLGTLIESGVALPDALDASAGATGNLHIREKVRGMATRVREGASLTRAATDAGCFPPMLVAMIASGEASARLGSALTRAAVDQQRDLDALVTTLVALVEPGVILLMGGFVLLMVLSILLPIVNLNELAGTGL